MKKITLLLIVAAFALGLTACSKDAEVTAFLTELDSVTQDIASKINASPDADGIAAAQKAFDAKKASLKGKWDAIKDAVGFQVSADTKKKLEDTVKKDMEIIVGLAGKHAMSIAESAEATKAWEKLLKDYTDVITEGK